MYPPRDFDQIILGCRKLVERKSFRKRILSLFSTNDVKDRIQDMRIQINTVQNRFLVRFLSALLYEVLV